MTLSLEANFMAKEYHPKSVHIYLFFEEVHFASLLESAAISMIKMLTSEINDSIAYFELSSLLYQYSQKHFAQE